MSNAQLYIAFAIPSTIALLGVLTTLTTFVVPTAPLRNAWTQSTNVWTRSTRV